MSSAVRALALSLLVVSVSPVRAAALPPVHDGLSAPAQVWGKAMESGDLTALSRMHRPDTISYPPGQTKLVGDKAILADYVALFTRYTVRVSSEDTHWIESGPLVVSWGQTILTLHPKAGGADIVSRTRFTDAALKTVDGWRYVVDHASTPKAP